MKYFIFTWIVVSILLPLATLDCVDSTQQFVFLLQAILLGVCATLMVSLHKSVPRYIYIIIGLIALVISIVHVSTNTRTQTIKTEYCIELINQDKVKVHSHSTDRIYICDFGKIQEVLIIDNE